MKTTYMEHLENNSSEIQHFLSKPSNFLTRQGIFQRRNQLNTTMKGSCSWPTLWTIRNFWPPFPAPSKLKYGTSAIDIHWSFFRIVPNFHLMISVFLISLPLKIRDPATLHRGRGTNDPLRHVFVLDCPPGQETSTSDVCNVQHNHSLREVFEWNIHQQYPLYLDYHGLPEMSIHSTDTGWQGLLVYGLW